MNHFTLRLSTVNDSQYVFWLLCLVLSILLQVWTRVQQILMEHCLMSWFCVYLTSTWSNQRQTDTTVIIIIMSHGRDYLHYSPHHQSPYQTSGAVMSWSEEEETDSNSLEIRSNQSRVSYNRFNQSRAWTQHSSYTWRSPDGQRVSPSVRDSILPSQTVRL